MLRDIVSQAFAFCAEHQHDRACRKATLFSFAARKARLPGRVRDLTLGIDQPKAETYALESGHTYVVSGTAQLPTRV